MKFVSLGVTAEVVVIFQDKNLCARTGFFAIKVCCGKAADASANDDKIVFLGKRARCRCILPERAIAQAMCDFKGTWMASAQADGNRRIVTRMILRFVAALS